LYSLLTCPAAADSYGAHYIDLAWSLFQDAAPTSEHGRGLLYRRMASARPQRARALVAFGSQDGIFPVEHFVSLMQHVSRMHETDGLLYCDPAEQAAPPAAELDRAGLRVHRFYFEPGGHALLFQDAVVADLAARLVKWMEAE
jgi:hypothetical protein